MGIWESLQGLTFEAKATIAIPLIVVVLIEIRREIVHRSDRQRMAQRDAADLLQRRAILQLEPPQGGGRGKAVMTLGNVEHTGREAGQHFVGSIRNAGPHLAEGIRITADLGGDEARVMRAPLILQPYSRAEPIDLMVPIGPLTYADIMGMIRAGERLTVRIDYVDGTPAPDPVFRCFVFRLEQVNGGTNWVSHPAPCSAPPEDPDKSHT